MSWRSGRFRPSRISARATRPTCARCRMLDRERILAKLDEVSGYLSELRTIVPATIVEYRQVEKRRACERILQITVECVIDIANLFVSGLRLGLPAEENDIFEKLERHGVISADMVGGPKRMKGG